MINLEHAVDFDGALFILDDETGFPSAGSWLKMQDRLLWIFCFKGDIEYEYYIKTCSGAYGNDFWSVFAYLPVQTYLKTTARQTGCMACTSSGRNLSP